MSIGSNLFLSSQRFSNHCWASWSDTRRTFDSKEGNDLSFPGGGGGGWGGGGCSHLKRTGMLLGN